MTRWLADTPIRRKITVLMVVTAALALVGAGAALGGYEVLTFRRTLAQKLTTVADIIGRNCTAALAFGDKTVARDVLGALEAEPSVESGTVYDRGGQVFATYRPGPRRRQPPAATARISPAARSSSFGRSCSMASASARCTCKPRSTSCGGGCCCSRR